MGEALTGIDLGLSFSMFLSGILSGYTQALEV
jgi:hypothetical protein